MLLEGSTTACTPASPAAAVPRRAHTLALALVRQEAELAREARPVAHLLRY